MQMKNILTSISAVILLAGCSWTEAEHLSFYPQTPEEADQAGYASYLENLRAYKNGYHKVMVIGMDGTSAYPERQNQLPMAMPDSADFIYIRNAENLHQIVVDEISEVREKKGTRVLSCVDFGPAMEKWMELKQERIDGGLEPPTDEELETLFTEDAGRQLAACDRYGFDGVVVSYENGIFSQEDRKAQESFMEAVALWKEEHQESMLFLRGSVSIISNESILDDSDYFILKMGGTSGKVNYEKLLRGTVGTMEQTDKNILEFTVPSTEEPEIEGDLPCEAARIVLEHFGDGYEYGGKLMEILGIGVENAQDDYYNRSYTVGVGESAASYTVGNFAYIRPAVTVLAGE